MTLIRKAIRYAMADSKRFLIPYYAHRINSKGNDLFDVAFNSDFLGLSIAPLQVKSEIERLIGVVTNMRPRRILEIGTATGGTLFLFCKFAHPNAVIVSIDLPKGESWGGYPAWKIPLFMSFKLPDQSLRLIRADSHLKTTREALEEILGGELLDFLFIDGDHTYEGVKRDFEMYFPLVRKGGIIAFHDICKHPLGSDCQVEYLWERLRQSYYCKEIVENPKQGWGGIGVLHVPD